MRLRGVPAAKAALPIELPMLRAMLAQLPSIHTGHDLRMYKAAFTLAFACFLQCGEIVHGPFQRPIHLSVKSVFFGPALSYAVVTLPSSKMDIGCTGIKVVAPATEGIECPVKALRAITTGRLGNEPLFHHFGMDSFDRDRFITTVHKCIKLCNTSPDGFSGHSFRQGAATWASRVGYTEEEIKVMGRWNSDCVRRYIDRSAEQRCALAKKMFQVLSNSTAVDVSTSWRQF